jgi:hypothetical protein
LAWIWRANAFTTAEVEKFSKGERFESSEFGLFVGLGWVGRLNAESFTFVGVDSGDGGDEVAEFGGGEEADGVGGILFIEGILLILGKNEFTEGETQHGQISLLFLPDAVDTVMEGSVGRSRAGRERLRGVLVRRGGRRRRGRARLAMLRGSERVSPGGIGERASIGVKRVFEI